MVKYAGRKTIRLAKMWGKYKEVPKDQSTLTKLGWLENSRAKQTETLSYNTIGFSGCEKLCGVWGELSFLLKNTWSGWKC